MALPKSDGKRIKRLENQQMKHILNKKMVDRLQIRIDTIKNTDK